ncbi:hypothetical protein A8713_06785 [Streptomyces sp. SAT1]|nr:hypothetical protein A8713_06785 [Streptomyces sp. SAT1]
MAPSAVRTAAPAAPVTVVVSGVAAANGTAGVTRVATAMLSRRTLAHAVATSMRADSSRISLETRAFSSSISR